MRIRTGDMVQVIAGNDAGLRGKVLRMDLKKGRLVVEGANRVYKHVRRTQRNPQGGRLSKEMPIDLSNVMLVCGSCNEPTRVGSREPKEGQKERFCKKCGAGLGIITTARKAKT